MYAGVLKQTANSEFQLTSSLANERERDGATVSIRSRDFTIKPNSISQTYPNKGGFFHLQHIRK